MIVFEEQTSNLKPFVDENYQYLDMCLESTPGNKSRKYIVWSGLRGQGEFVWFDLLSLLTVVA